MQQYILAFDQGTTSSRAIVFDAAGRIVSVVQKEFTQFFPQPGWVEHDAEEIWSTQLGTAAEAITRAGLTANHIAAIGITNQRETTVLWNRHTGKPVCRAIVWQDRRTADFCDELRARHREMIVEKTGLVPDAYFSASKLRWMLEHVPDARKMAQQGDLLFGTIDTWLLWKLTGGKVHATDVSNASRTMMMNLSTLHWDEDLISLFDIPRSVLPVIKSSSELYGTTEHILTSHAIPIAGMLGDQQSALFGQMCIEPGMVKNTYGTGCFMLMQTGEQIVHSKHHLLTTVAWQLNGKTQYALEGSVFIAGAVVQWLRDSIGLIASSAEIEQLASSVPDAGGVTLVPAFTGLGAPYWNQHARGLITGLTRGSTDAHIARAALQSIAFQTADVLHAMQADAGIPIRALRVDGGATANQLLMQFQSDVLQTTVVRPAITETTALGAAYMAGLAVGYWPNLSTLQQQWQEERRFQPSMPAEKAATLYREWQRAVKAALYWSNDSV